jgi:LPXTG-site transpeptidase (sortase) family protein
VKRRMIAFGIISPLVLTAVCAGALLLMGIAAWLLIYQEDQPKVIQIIPLAPLTGPKATSTVSVPQEAERSSEPTATEAVSLATVVPENQPASANSDIAQFSPEEVAEVLGFALPPGSVNSITEEGVADRLIIPKLDLDRAIVLSPIENQTWRVDHLGQSIGHLEGTAPPGSNSNIVLAAHVTLGTGVYGPFAGLAQLAAGDVIYVYSGEQKFEYIVDGYQTVDRTSVEVTYPSESGEITLITCSNWDGGEGRYIDRLVVKGHLVEG